MATDVERLVVSLDASITKYERAMQRALGQTNTTAKRIEDRFAQTEVRIGQRFANAGILIGKAFASAAALRSAQLLIDSSVRIENSLKVAGLAGTELTQVYNNLFASAQRNAAPIEALSTLYSRAATNAKELGAGQSDLIKFTDVVATSLRAGGASAESASGALLQLGQALGSSKIQAEEYNSLIDGARPLLQAVAAGIKEAGGSVATLTALVKDGKISNKAFFDGAIAGSSVLEAQLAGSELTISSAFVRLQNVLIDVAGKFDTNTNASSSFARSLDQLGTAITNLSNNDGFNNFIADVNDFGNKEFDNTVREFERIGAAIDAVKKQFSDIGNEVAITASQAGAAQSAMEQFAIANSGVYSPEVEAAFRDLIGQLISGRGSAETATAAIMAMGAADPSFDKVIGKVSNLITTFIALRDAATAALLATDAGANVSASDKARGHALPEPLPSNEVKPITLANYPIVGGGGGGRGGGQSPSQKFDDDLKQQAEETRLLNEKTAALAKLDPLARNYTFEVEKLRVQQELENDASKAGLALSPDRKAAIDALATGYANATIEAAKLAEAQDGAHQSMEDWFSTGRDVTRGFIDDLVEGKSAAEALGNAFGKIGERFLDMGLDALFGTGKGSSPFGFLGSLFGFAKGGVAAGGKPMKTFAGGGVSKSAAIFGEAGPEAAVPLPDGRRIPVDLRMPAMPTMAAPAQAVHVTVGVSADSAGNLMPFVESVAQRTVLQATPSIVSSSVKATNKQLPSLMQEIRMRQD